MTEQPNFDCVKCSSREFYDTCSNCHPTKNFCLRCYKSHECEYQEENPLPISANNTTNISSSSTFDELQVLPTHNQNQHLKTEKSPQSFNFFSKPTFTTHNPPSVKPNSSTTSHSNTSTRYISAYKTTLKNSIPPVSVRPINTTSSRSHAPTTRPHEPSKQFESPTTKTITPNPHSLSRPESRKNITHHQTTISIIQTNHYPSSIRIKT